MKGNSLRLPCSAPDPRYAARSKLKHSNMLDIGYPHRISSGDEEDEPESPLDVLKEDDIYDAADDNDFSQGGDDKEHSSDFEQGDDDSVVYDDFPRRRGSDRYRKKQRGKEANNKKLERKQLEGSRKRKPPLKPEIRDDEDYKDGVEREQISPVTYIWFHNGTEIKGNESRRYVMPDGALFFRKFGSRKMQKGGLQDTGEYRCMANASSGAILSTVFNLTYAFMEREFTRYPVDTEVYEGDAVQLSCSIDSNPPAKISWMKDSKYMSKVNKRIYHLSPTCILITNIGPDDVGKYRCVAKNNVVNKTHLSPEAIITVMKHTQSTYPISFVTDKFENSNDTQSEYIKNVTAYYGDDVFLSCAVNGKPKPKVVWSYQAESSNVEVKEISSMEIHRIPKITEDKSGVYTCVANNVHQSIKQVYRVDVLRGPYLRQFPTSMHLPTAKTVRFNCSAGGSPAPSLQWYRDGLPLNITGRIKLKSQDNKSPELIISDTISADKGMYQCMAWNTVGEITAWASLTLQTQNVPPPHNVKCQPIGPDSVRISWSPPKEPVMAYTVHHVLADGGEEYSQILTDVTYDLKKLEAYRKYDTYIKTYSTHGASDQSEHFICHGQGVRIYLSSMENSSIHITWKDQAGVIKSWMVQWRSINESNPVINNVTLPGNVNYYIVPDAFPVDKYEYRVLASPSEDWIDQDLELIPWTSAKTRNVGPYRGPVLSKNQSHLDDFDASSPRIQDPEITDWTGQDSPRPTNVMAKALGPHSINISWLCDAAESSSDAYSFEVCYSLSNHAISETKMIKMEKKNETCQQSFNTFLIVRGLEPATYYAIRVQAIMQNKPIGGPFSETVMCRTMRDEKSSISDVRWKKVANDVLQISWTHILNTNLLEDDDSFIELSEDRIDNNYVSLKRSWTYTVRYSQDISLPLEQWPSKNVTDQTNIELRDLDPEKGCFVMVFVAGENKGSPLDISAKDMKMTPVAVGVNELLNKQLGTAFGVLVVLLLVLLFAVLWRRMKFRRERERQLGIQNGSRANKSMFECQELVTRPPYNDVKGGEIYINCLESEGTMSSEVGEPLLNGHIRITENPRFMGRNYMGNGNCNCKPLLGKKSLGPVFDGTFDVSRYEELPDVTIETVLEADVCDHVGSEASQSTLRVGWKGTPSQGETENEHNGDVTGHTVVDVVNGSSNIAIDRNSNSELTNTKNLNESLGNKITISDKSYLNKKSGAKSYAAAESDTQEMENCNMQAENVKNKCGVDALSGYRENGGSRRIAPVIGPNG